MKILLLTLAMLTSFRLVSAQEGVSPARVIDLVQDGKAACAKLAETPAEKQRVAQWRSSLWDWMRQGREQHLTKAKQKGQ